MKIMCMKGTYCEIVNGVKNAEILTGVEKSYISHLMQTGGEKNGWTFDEAVGTCQQTSIDIKTKGSKNQNNSDNSRSKARPQVTQTITMH